MERQCPDLVKQVKPLSSWSGGCDWDSDNICLSAEAQMLKNK